MVKFNKTGTVILVAGFLFIAAFAAAYEDIGVPELLFSGLVVVLLAMIRRFTARNTNALADLEFQDSGSGGDHERPGDTLTQLLDDLEEFERRMGRRGIHISRANSLIRAYPVPSLDGDTYMLYSIIPTDRDTGQDIHIVVEANTGQILQHNPVQTRREYIWPFDYCPVVEALEKAQAMRNSSSIRETLKAMSSGQLHGDYSNLVMDKDIQHTDDVITIEGGGPRPDG